jgi:hypothetical protein
MVRNSSVNQLKKDTNTFPGFGEILLYLQILDEL